MKKKRGPSPIDGIKRDVLVACKATKRDIVALEQVMAKEGIETRSKALLKAMRAYAKAKGFGDDIQPLKSTKKDA